MQNSSVLFVHLLLYHTTPALCLFVMSAISSAICRQLTTVRKIVRQQNRRSSVNKALTLVDSSTQGISMRNRTISVCQLAPVFRKKTYEFCNKTGHAINTRTFTIYSIYLWTGYEGNSKFMVFQDVNYDPDFYIFMSTANYNDRLLVILHALRITFCVCSPVDSFFCGVTFGKCSIKIYRNKTWYLALIQNIKIYTKLTLFYSNWIFEVVFTTITL